MNGLKPNMFKQIPFITLLILSCVINNNIFCQQSNCEVLLDEIKGTYSGECVKGKAFGLGKSIGTDTYEGNFKDGLPDGSGKYTWKNENYYVGNWKKGRFEGSGEMHFKTGTLQDSIITGFWKKGKYIGLYEKQFIVIASTSKINKVDCRMTDAKGEDIFITFHQNVARESISSSPQVPVVSNISTILGTFYSKNSQVLTNSSITRIQQVTFPFRVILFFSNGENTEILFNEKGNYDVYIDSQ